MLARFSVKKPYTVVVAVVLVLILGVVSFTKMNTDLLPSMDLPYAIVMTTYQGASPETVETVVTKPIEQSMATVTSIENVSSISQENISLVILEFEETANMDSATIEMRENLDQISSYWDDSVGKSIIMKLNPDMMPVMVAAVEVEGMKDTEVTDFVTEHVEPELESIAGVASVTTTGTITEDVDVLIREDKIAAMDQRVKNALYGTFYEQEQELLDAQSELDANRSELESKKNQLGSGRDELGSGKQQAAEQIGEGAAQLNEAQVQLIEGRRELEKNLELLEEKQTELDSRRESLYASEAEAKKGLAQLEQAKSALEQLPAAINSMQEKKAELEGKLTEAKEALTQIQAALQFAPDTPELKEKEAELTSGIGLMEKGIQDLDLKIQETQGSLDTLLESFGADSAEEGLKNIKTQIKEVKEGLAKIEEGKEKLEEGQAQLDEGREKILAAREQLEEGQDKISSGIAQLNTQQILASVEMSIAQSKIDIGTFQMESAQQQMDTAQKQLDSGREQLDDARDEALKKSELDGIITVDMVKGILAAENFSMPAGYVGEDSEKYLVRVGDKLQDVKSLQELVILDMDLDNLNPICLAEVAEVAVHNNSSEIYANLNGNPGVMLSIEKQTGYSTGDVTDRILERFEELEDTYGQLGVSVMMDQGIYIDLVVDSVLQNMIFGAVLAVFILFVFLKDIRPTLVIACSIPISVVTALVLMYFSGVTLNIISLSGLALGIGMLVDNSIVVIENIYRMRGEGIPAKRAAVAGASQVAGAISASTLTTVCVFAPIVFTEGLTRQLFVDMGLTIAYSLLASLAVALTLVPMMSAGLLKRVQAKPARIMTKIQGFYGKTLRLSLRLKYLVLLLGVVLLAVSMMASFSKGTAFMPEMESTQVSMTVSVEKDQNFQDLTRAADQVVESIEDIPDIDSIGAMAGGSMMSSMMGGSSQDSVSMYLVLKEDRQWGNERFEKEVLKRTKDIDCQVDVQTSSMDMSALGSSGIQVQIAGQDLDTLQELAAKAAAIIEDVPGVTNVSDGMEGSDKELRVVVDKAKAMGHGLTVAQVFQEIQKHLAEASAATTLAAEEKDYKVYVRTDTDEDLTKEELERMQLEYKDAKGEEQKVHLRDIAAFQEAVTPQSIQRDAQSRYMSVTAELETGYNIGLVSADVEETLEDFSLPKGYTMEMQGENETIQDAMGQLVLMLVLAVVFMYLIMVAQFQSLLSPFIVMFTIPLAFTGGFAALYITGNEVSVIAMIGFVMLAGIIVNNGIVLVDYMNQLRMDGMEKREAIIQAGKSRLRPVIMTALTTILGLSTMALGMGMGADMVQPMAIVTIGGLLYGTLLTLYVVPCIYDILNRKEYKRDEERLDDGDEKAGDDDALPQPVKEDPDDGDL